MFWSGQIPGPLSIKRMTGRSRKSWIASPCVQFSGLITVCAVVFAMLYFALRSPGVAPTPLFQKHARSLPDVFNTPSPPPQPTLRISDDTLSQKIDSKRGIYGGKGDAAHVGGFLQNDTQSYEPWVWDFLINEMQIKSMVDIGCGRGISTNYFHKRGVNAQCFEGSPDGIARSLVPGLTKLHDFTRGPVWTDEIVDIAWAIEFLEHVDVAYMQNYMATMKKARFVFVSHSIWGGWHHVTVKKRYWWIEAFRDFGFEYMPDFSEEMRKKCPRQHPGFPDGKRGYTYFGFNGMVFRNVDIPLKFELHPWENEAKTQEQYNELKIE